MVRAGSSPGARHRTAPPWLLSPAVLGVGCGIALLAVPAHLRWPVAWCGIVSVAVTLATSAMSVRGARLAEDSRRRREDDTLRQRFAARERELTGGLSDQRATTIWLAEELLPAAVARLRKGESATEILQSVPLGDHLDSGFAAAIRGVVGTLLEAVQAEEDAKDSSQRALVAIARRVQAFVHQLAKDLHQMQILHGTDLRLATDLQHVEHRTALIGRIAASIAVLGDGRPGRQWEKAIPLYDIVRGAMSRIVDYPRVKLQSITEVAVVGHGAEPLIHLLAELLDNATSFSPPRAPVEVTASEVPSGIAIEIEDRGVGLTEEIRQRVDGLMARASSGIDLADLGEVTQLGLPVVSKVAHEHGIDVELRTSAYGGVRAVVLVPRRLITTVPQPSPAKKNAPRVPRPAMNDDPVAKPAEVRRTVNGLPQRERQSAAPAPIVSTSSRLSATRGAPATVGSAVPQPGRMWEAFQGEPDGADSDTTNGEPTDKGE